MESNFSNSSFVGAKLQGADFVRAALVNTNFAGANLRERQISQVLNLSEG